MARVATQALVNPLYGIDGLKLIREGVGAADVVRILTARDAGREHRQLHVMDADGRFAAHTGAECVTGAATGAARISRSPATCWPDRRSCRRRCGVLRERRPASCRAA